MCLTPWFVNVYATLPFQRIKNTGKSVVRLHKFGFHTGQSQKKQPSDRLLWLHPHGAGAGRGVLHSAAGGVVLGGHGRAAGASGDDEPSDEGRTRSGDVGDFEILGRQVEQAIVIPIWGPLR